jgi:hypothetical protein
MTKTFLKKICASNSISLQSYFYFDKILCQMHFRLRENLKNSFNTYSLILLLFIHVRMVNLHSHSTYELQPYTLFASFSFYSTQLLTNWNGI